MIPPNITDITLYLKSVFYNWLITGGWKLSITYSILFAIFIIVTITYMLTR